MGLFHFLIRQARSFYRGLFYLGLALSCGLSALASPFPATGTALLAPQKGLFFIAHGFQLTTPAGWTLQEPFTFVSPQRASAKLAVKEDLLPAETHLENYAKRWMKDYTSYGFDFLGSRPFINTSLGNKTTKGLVVDLLHKSSDRQLRQVIFLNRKHAVILTCVDQKEKFSQTLNDCNQMVRSFEWIDPIHPKAF